MSLGTYYNFSVCKFELHYTADGHATIKLQLTSCDTISSSCDKETFSRRQIVVLGPGEHVEDIKYS